MTTPPAGPPQNLPPHNRPPHGQSQGHPAQPPGPQAAQYPTQQYPQQPYPPQQPGAARTPQQKQASAVWTLALISVVGVVLGLSINEDNHNLWDTVNAWGGLAIAGAVLTIVPVIGHSLGLSPVRAWQVGVAGAVALVLFWVLMLLPVIDRNTSLLATIGVAAGVFAAWIAPGRPAGDPAPQGGPQRPTW